ncbi:hypothetical protein Ancab_015458 [Ancistrocladus abbreviatus]
MKHYNPIRDHYLRQYVLSKPETTTCRRTHSDEFLIIASDGLWDVLSDEAACQFVSSCLNGQMKRVLASGVAGCPAAVVAALLEEAQTIQNPNVRKNQYHTLRFQLTRMPSRERKVELQMFVCSRRCMFLILSNRNTQLKCEMLSCFTVMYIPILPDAEWDAWPKYPKSIASTFMEKRVFRYQGMVYGMTSTGVLKENCHPLSMEDVVMLLKLHHVEPIVNLSS